jgi:hypothetical protein
LTPCTETRGLSAGLRPQLTIVGHCGYTFEHWLREMGRPASIWLCLRSRVVFAEHTLSPAALRDLVRTSALVYLPKAREDLGRLAADCVEAGAVLIAERRYDAARRYFSDTTFGERDRAWSRKLSLWLVADQRARERLQEGARRRLESHTPAAQVARLLLRLRTKRPEFGAFVSSEHTPSLLRRIEYRSGPRHFAYDEDECAVVCLVRNGKDHLPSFLQHYREMGVRRFVFLDNLSDDGTGDWLSTQPDVTLYVSDLPHKHYECEMRRALVELHCQGRFCLSVDADELFDYPGSSQQSLGQLLRYLKRCGATAMAGYMLDMFDTVNAFQSRDHLDLKRAYPYYDVSGVKRSPYFTEHSSPYCGHNTLGDATIESLSGGVRRRIFGGPSSEYLLTKHPLIFVDGTLEPVTHPHYSDRALLADATCVLYHYKFTPSFQRHVEESCRNARYTPFAQRQYDLYRRGIGRERALRIDAPLAERLSGPEQLLERGFLWASDRYRDQLRSATAASAPAITSDSVAPSRRASLLETAGRGIWS